MTRKNRQQTLAAIKFILDTKRGTIAFHNHAANIVITTCETSFGTLYRSIQDSTKAFATVDEAIAHDQTIL